MSNVGLVIEGEDKELYVLILFRTSRIENEENAKKKWYTKKSLLIGKYK